MPFVFLRMPYLGIVLNCCLSSILISQWYQNIFFFRITWPFSHLKLLLFCLDPQRDAGSVKKKVGSKKAFWGLEMGRNSPPTLRGHRGSRDPPRLPSYSGVQQLTAPTYQGQWGLTAPFVQCTAARGARTKLPFWLQVVKAEQPEGAVQLGPTLFPLSAAHPFVYFW